jgi:hypothetical protein
VFSIRYVMFAKKIISVLLREFGTSQVQRGSNVGCSQRVLELLIDLIEIRLRATGPISLIGSIDSISEPGSMVIVVRR